MSSNLVIVAIPDENDRVWKISSEKVPHMTLLFLGDSEKVANLDQIMLFVEHAASTSLKRFYLPVDRRGELGDDKADVLFFKKDRYDFKAVRDFRHLLLKDNNVKTAYDSSTQFEAPEAVGRSGQPWIPHLTLGYPTSPAKSENDDWGSIYSVDFNKVAVWTGNFEGPEFLLKDYWEEFDEMAIPMDVAMSELAHYGKKGMKWGVRKQEVGSGGHIRISEKTGQAGLSTPNQVALVGLAVTMPPLIPALFLSPRFRAELKATRAQNKLAQGDKQYKKSIEKSKKAVEVHNTAADEINAKVGAFNSDKRWKKDDGSDIHLPSNPTKQKEYDDAVTGELINPAYARAAVKVYGSDSPSGRYKFEINDASTGTLKFRDTLAEKKQAQHADDDNALSVDIKFNLIRDQNGHILGFEPEEKEDSMTQTAELGAEFLEHFGVKGMKWGRRAAAGAKATSTFVRDVNFESRTARGPEGQASKATNMVASASRKPFKKEDLPAVKARHGDYAKMTKRATKPFSKEAKAYRKDARETYVKRLETTANSMKNASGTRQYTVRERGIDLPAQGGNLPKSKYFWEVSARDVKHAAINVDVRLELVMEDGYITDLNPVPVEDSLAQSAFDVGEDFVLEHFGVKGMRWGQRKSPPEAVATSARSIVPHGTKRKTKVKVEGGENQPAHEDAVKVAEARTKLSKSGTAALSNQELRDVANRLQLENQVAVLTSSRGKKFVTRNLEIEGERAVKKGVKRAAPHVVKKAGKTAATTAVTLALL